MEWYKKAAEKGVADAQLYVGAMMANGSGTAKDPKQAADYMFV